MCERCSKCGRVRPDYIADPTCSMGGYCDWQEAVVVELTANEVVEAIILAARVRSGVSGFAKAKYTTYADGHAKIVFEPMPNVTPIRGSTGRSRSTKKR